MAIYRFETIGDSEVVSDRIILLNTGNRCFCNRYEVTKETHDRLLAELEANESAADVDDGWKPASEPPDSSRDVWAVVRSSDGTRTVCEVYCVDKRRWWNCPAPTGCALEDYGSVVECWKDRMVPPLPTPQPEPPKKPEPVWQGPGWYECVQFREPKLVVASSSGCSTVRGVTIFESDLTSLIRLATDGELRHVCTEEHMTIKRGDTVRLKSDLMFVDGSSFPSGAVFNVVRLFNVKTGTGQIEPRIAISNCDVLLRQVRLEDVEKQ